MSNAKKIVVKLDLHDNKDKQKALKAVSVLVGIDAVSVDMAAHKMTVIGTVDPVQVVSKLRSKSWAAHLDSIGPAKEPEKKAEEKKAEEKKDGEGKKEEAAGGDAAAAAEKDCNCDHGEGKKEEAGDGKKEEAAGDGKKEDGEGKKDDGGEGKKEDKKEEEGKKQDGEKKPAVVGAPWMHQLPPQYMHMITNDYYMNQYHRPPPPPPVYHHPYAAPPQQYYYMRNMSMEENPNSCTIS